MKRILAALTFVLLAGSLATLSAIEREPIEVYHQRRADLAKKLNGGMLVLFAARDGGAAESLTSFRQEDYFYYLTGWNEPDAVLVLLPPGDGTPAREIFFLPARDARRERWEGPKLSPGDEGIAAKTGFDQVLPRTQFDDELKRLSNGSNIGSKIVWTLTPGRGQDYSVEAQNLAKLKTLASAAEIRDARPLVNPMRAVKSPGEQALITKSVACSMDAHREAMKAVKPGAMEYEIAALMNYTQHREGCIRPAYAPIVGSGFFSTVLHYDANDKRMEAGEVVVIDVAGEYAGYAADITRTLPVSGKFTPRQREIYEIVLGAQKAAIAEIKPGMEMRALQKIAMDYINAHGKDLKGETLGRYFIHGLGHDVGLNVHDPNGGVPLQAGQIITMEPGIYIPDEKLGVRIEDMVLVTATGAQLLTDSLPREAAEVEKAMMPGRR